MKAVCPVCQNEIILEENAKAFLNISHVVPWFLSHEQLLDAVVKGEFRDSHSKRKFIHWACDDCLDKGKALLADPNKQKFVDCVPYYAYFNLQRHCETCGQNFIFSSNEQRFWYEDLMFWVQSQPKDCANCRRKKRERRVQSDFDRT
jgi:hypothetical protein